MHTAVRQLFPTDNRIRGGFGVGLPISARTVPGITGGVDVLLDTAARHPGETGTAGISDRDLAKAHVASTGPTTTDVTKGGGRKLGAPHPRGPPGADQRARPGRTAQHKQRS
jgi:hypothetical protein